MNSFNIHGGHNPDDKIACGACGFIKESTEDRKVKDEVIRLLKNENKICYDTTCDNGSGKNDVLRRIVAKCNAHSVDLDISIHFNSGADDEKGNGHTTGVEVLCYDNRAYDVANRICNEIAKLGFTNRGIKYRKDLCVLRETKSLAILIECCFVDDKDDITQYDYKSMSKAIVQGILNKQINQGGTKHMYKYALLYKGEVDKTIATVMSWGLKDCIVKDVDEHQKWEANTIYTVGTPAGNRMAQIVANQSSSKENFHKIEGEDRFDTLKKGLKFINNN